MSDGSRPPYKNKGLISNSIFVNGNMNFKKYIFLPLFQHPGGMEIILEHAGETLSYFLFASICTFASNFFFFF